jgi:apolipoprotein N-acyltransferase
MNIAKPKKLTPSELLVGLAVGALALNWLVGHYLGYPFLACWFGPLLTAVYMAWGSVLLYVVVLYILYALFWRRDVIRVLSAAALLFVIIELPRLAAYMLGGGSCG